MGNFQIIVSCFLIHNLISLTRGFNNKTISARQDENIYTTHSESTRPVHVPIFQRFPVNVPHPIPVAVPQYVKVPIPAPYPHYTRVQHPIEVPVYRIVPEIVEKPLPFTVEKPFPIEVERPFPIEVIRKFQIPIPKPYPVHTILYKHINEDDPPPKKKRISSRKSIRPVKKNPKIVRDLRGY